MLCCVALCCVVLCCFLANLKKIFFLRIAFSSNEVVFSCVVLSRLANRRSLKKDRETPSRMADFMKVKKDYSSPLFNQLTVTAGETLTVDWNKW